MLPLQQAYEVQYSILEYLKATFSFKDREVHDAFYRFITHKEEGIFKGPYLSLKLPFIKAGINEKIPLEIKPGFPPYFHQLQAFNRLTTADNHQPESTLITTGTSSGKTECFMYPVLDYCYRHSDRPGIKVIILYPMNALATDQAKRLAETIWNDEKLKGKVTAGLFIGEGKDKKKFATEMGPSNIIENRITIVDNPPDILLTNFKMLDFALMRNHFHSLLQYNLEDPSLLKFLVLDELHTYDGAQGTDVANLVRRLKLKLNIPKGQLCAVGTSATIGSGEDAAPLLTKYAAKVFGEDFNRDAVITEKRISPDDFFSGNAELEQYIPRQIGLRESRMQNDETYATYIKRQKRLWQIPESTPATGLGEELKKLQLVKDILSLTSKGVILLGDLLKKLSDINPGFRQFPEWDPGMELNPREEIINSLLALISEAKDGKFPFLFLQVQVWIRELSGVLRIMGEEPVFTWKDKVPEPHEPKAMPAYYCRECGASGWLGVKNDNHNAFQTDYTQVYDHFFSNHKNIYFINTQDHQHLDEYQPDNLINEYIHVADMYLHQRKGDHTFRIHAVRKLSGSKGRHICPECNTENTLGIIGTRIATLSSISVAQVLSSDLDARENQDRKILAFTNSVQDAAHQAGFTEARNYRFTFRASLQKVINDIKEPLTLTSLQERFCDYWKSNADTSRKNDLTAYYFRFFPADYHGKVDLKSDYRDKAGNFIKTFRQEFDIRMSWEITAEFGYNATIGRTLEKTCSSGVFFDKDKMKSIYPSMKQWLNVNNLEYIDENSFNGFLNGILTRIRIRGGVDHDYLSKARDKILSRWNLNWNSDPRHFLNKYFGKKARLPKVVGTAQQRGEIMDITYTTTTNWFHKYFIKTFPLTAYTPLINEFYQQLFNNLLEAGILNKKGEGEDENYAIDPSAIWVENNAVTYCCSKCSSRLHVASSDQWVSYSRCLDYRCDGIYETKLPAKPNYYQLVYNRNLSPRIYAAEHTGILERADREEKEKDFKERPFHNSLNTIVATSTLEMGIDIGTLNTVINNAVPPLPSNFIQRVGRAGRSSGSALIVNFAQSKAHDLYYYELPADMMQGQINTPGCFLEAQEILIRHFLAYCFDAWATADPKNNGIPGRMITLRLSRTDLSATDFFVNKVISFIKANEQRLLNDFTAIFQEDINDGVVLNRLKVYLQEEILFQRLRKVFAKLKDEYLQISDTLKHLETTIKELPADQERKELETERKAILGLKRMLDKRSVIEHMINVGILPNYAFPETGVTLNAWVKGSRAKQSDALPVDYKFEIVRSSRSALREMAPDNFFYSQGFKFEITGLNTYDWKDEGVLVQKRFCSNCDHLDEGNEVHAASCPKCNDPSWASEKNRHTFIKINAVKSVNLKEKAVLDDSSEEREKNAYRISRHLKFDHTSFQGAWGMKEIPFGIEYVKNISMAEANMGLSAAVSSNKITINSQEDVPCHGFVTCRYCGKSTSRINPGVTVFHFGYCKYKDKVYEGKKDNVFEEVYLLRELKTEALKILLPVQEFESEAMVSMFKAGLEVGLKKYYQGNPQHLEIVDYREYNHKNSRFDRYLVMYDAIPGGTGYLEKLFNPSVFTEVLKLAYSEIKECICKVKGRDGCYRCIYTYANQYIREELSREKAEKLFKKIVDKAEEWEQFNTGLGALTSNGQIEESELEDRFIRSLRNYCTIKAKDSCSFEEVLTDGIVQYKFSITNGDYRFYYMVRPQYELGEKDGVRNFTRADFLISLTGVDKSGVAIKDEMLLSGTKKIAVYLDGYTYHATAENMRFFGDVSKRMAIQESAEYISWTLCWNDLERFDLPDESTDSVIRAFKKDPLFIEPQLYANTKTAYLSVPYWDKFKSQLIQCRNSLERLIWLLGNPLPEHHASEKIALALSLRQQQFGSPSVDENELDHFLGKWESGDKISIKASNTSKGDFYIFPEIQDVNSFSDILLAVRVIDLKSLAKIRLIENEQSLDRNSWERFWQVFNLVQYFID